jgi:eukaryotic-like serine/threonine-protein kinase
LNPAWEEHFDELVELGEAERAGRLAALAHENPDLARFLGKLLAADSGADGTLPEPLAARAPGFVAGAFAEAGPVPEHGPEPEPSRDRAGERIGNYRLLSLLGRGGMAEVWLAERADGEFDSRAAIKLVRPDLGSENILSGFLRERRILARLVHPGITRLLDGGRSRSGEPYFVLEHVDGTPITGWCAGRGVSLEGRLRLMIEVCEAVDHAHRSLVVHRDLKPSNVLVDASGRPKLLDFGIARLLSPEPGSPGLAESGTTWLGARAFTPGYAAPEQILGEPVTTATDVYALGILLYELLTGEKPFPRTARSLPALIQEITTESLEPPSARLRRSGGTAPSLPRSGAARLAGDLDAILAKALAREPERRYAGASALAEDLERFLARRPVRARPASMAYRARRFLARNRLGVAATALAVLSLVGGLAVALWQARVARTEALRAERARGFLVSMFESLDPEEARSKAVTPSTLLAAGLRRIDRELAGEPELRADMLDLLANLHRKLGLLPEGRRLAENALVLRRQRFGEPSAEAAQSLVTLGWIRLDQGEPVVARELLERAISDLERIEGPESLAAADAREPLVEAIFAGEAPAPALPVVESRLATYRRILGDTHEKIGFTLNDRGVVLQALGRLDEAEVDYRESLALLRHLAADDPRLAYLHHNLGDLLLSRGRTEAAEKELRTAYELRRRSLGDRHPETALTLALLAQALLDRRHFGQAEAALRQVLELLTDKDRFTAASARLLLSQTLSLQSRYDESLISFERGISELEAVVGSGHILVLGARGERARVLLELGRKKEAMAELQAVIARLGTIGEVGVQSRAELLSLFAVEKRKAGKAGEARELHRQVRNVFVQMYGEEHFQVATVDYELALDLLAEPAAGDEAARRTEAVARLTRARDLLRRIDPDLPLLPAIERRLGLLQSTAPPAAEPAPN